MSKKVFAFTIIILLVLSTASPAFADVTSYDVSVYYPEPYVDEFSGYFSYSTSADLVITYAWTFLPYHGSFVSGSGEVGNASTYVEVDYLPSTSKFSFALFPGFLESSNFIMYRYVTDLSDNSTDMQMVEYLTVNGSTNLSYNSYATPLAYSLGGAVAFMDSENSALPALNITFGEVSNTNYSVEVFYNYYKYMMDFLYPAITVAFADINNIDLSVDNIENYTSQINSMTNSIINLLTLELTGSGTGTLDNPYTIRDLLVQIANNSGSEYSPSDLDRINAYLSSIASEVELYPRYIYLRTNSINNLLNDFTSEQLAHNDHLMDFFSVNSSFPSFYDLLRSVLEQVCSTFYYDYLEDHFNRQESFYDSAEAFFEAYNRRQVIDERLRYDDFQDSSLDIFSIFYWGVLRPFRDFWGNLSLDFKFDSGTEPSRNVVFDYLFDGDKYPGFNDLESVDWSTLP